MFSLPGSRMKGGGRAFPAGTVMFFRQTAAPLPGWTKLITHHDVGLRVVNGSVSQVTASSAFSTVFGQSATGATTLTTATIPAHAHAVPARTFVSGSGTPVTNGNVGTTFNTNTDGGSGESHTHTVSLQLNYVDVILASKN